MWHVCSWVCVGVCGMGVCVWLGGWVHVCVWVGGHGVSLAGLMWVCVRPCHLPIVADGHFASSYIIAPTILITLLHVISTSVTVHDLKHCWIVY